MPAISSRPAVGQRMPASHRHRLAGIHDVVRIERALDRAHDVERRFAVLGRHIFHLALADAVLAGARSAHGNGAQAGGAYATRY